ncbi:MAG: hypothetical protein AB7O59_16000 [Pirellulales bacterium]
MLTLLIGSVVVVFLVLGAGNPGSWHWLVPPGNESASGGAAPGSENQGESAQHVLISVAAAPPTDRAPAGNPPTDDDTGDQASPAADGTPRDNHAEHNDRGERLFPGVRPDYLAAVRDDTVFRPEESDGWFHLFGVVERAPEGELEHASLGPVGYLQLSQQPREYRGRVVTVSGIARAAKRITAPQNAFGVKQYYQVWLQADRQAADLMVVYCVELPAGFPLGVQLAENCSAVAVFFKRWAYQSQGGITTAPLLVARTLDWKPAAVPVQQPRQPLGEQITTAVVVALVISALVLALVVRRASSRRAAITAEPERNVGAALSTLAEEPRDDGQAG